MTDVEIGIYTHRWSQLQTQAIQAIAQHTKELQYSIVVTQSPGTSHENMNKVWRRFSAPYVVLMDEDVVVLQDGWLSSLIEALESDSNLGVVGCAETKSLPRSVLKADGIRLTYRSWVPAYVMAFKRDRVKFLRFDECIPGRMGMTDVDACIQIRKAGLLAACNREVLVYHPNRDDDLTRRDEDRPTLNEQRDWYPDQVAYMLEKWGTLYTSVVSEPP